MAGTSPAVTFPLPHHPTSSTRCGISGSSAGGIGNSRSLRPHPFERLTLARLHKTLPAAADVERHQQVEVFVGVAREGKRREAVGFDFDAEFLTQFADQRLLGALAGFELAAGKLPQPRELLAFGALSDQHAAVGVDQRDGDDD